MHTQKNNANISVDEAMMKAYLLDYWRASGQITPSTLIISELTFLGLSRRIDLAILKNNTLIGIEIKSELDSLRRLEGQLEEYAAYFDKIYVFTTEKHYMKSLQIASRNEGLLVLKNDGVKTVRRGRKQLVKNGQSFIKMMRATDLYQTLRKSGINPDSMERKALENLASKLPLKVLRNAAFGYLNKRFSERSERFWNSIGHNINPLDLLELRKTDYKSLSATRTDSVISMIQSGNLDKILRND